MQEGAAARWQPGPIAATALTLPAILAPLLFFIALFPARLLALPLLGLLSGFGQTGNWLAFGAWFTICLLLLLAAVGLLAQTLGLSALSRRIFIAAVSLWAVLPNVALVVFFALSAD
jgi:hypothetical protein